MAVYLGYTEVEIGDIASAGGGEPVRQIQMFMRAWWMPDCGPEQTVGLLNRRRFYDSFVDCNEANVYNFFSVAFEKIGIAAQPERMRVSIVHVQPLTF